MIIESNYSFRSGLCCCRCFFPLAFPGRLLRFKFDRRIHFSCAVISFLTNYICYSFDMQKLFIGPLIVTVLGLLTAFWWGGVAAFFTVAILAVLEITLSFDNAIVNAGVLRTMSAKWQQRFLVWGIAIAIFGARLVLPILIVSAVLLMSPVAVATLALFSPEHYGALLHSSHYAIGAFGGAFLFMISLKYFFDETKKFHWIESIEKHLARWGSIEAIEVMITLVALLLASFFERGEQSMILVAGIIGVVLFILMQALTGAMQGGVHAKAVTGGLAAFLYLEVLDTAFSLDGVVGAFAITTNIIWIMIGLGIGAYFVRSLTIALVRSHALRTLPYLEHGAHWAIMGLAATMIVGLVTEVPEVVTGTIGLVFVGAAYWSSLRARIVE